MSPSLVRFAESADGTSIAYRAVGTGEPIVFVHGAATASSDWVFTLPFFRERFTVVMMDRRGRGHSGDAIDYGMDREAEDILAVLDSVGSEVLVAHSYGALCSILAARSTDRLRSLVLYEPPIGVRAGLVAPVAALVATGELDAALAQFLRGAGVRPDELAAIRSSAAWPVLLDAVPVLPRELEAAVAWEHPRSPIEVPTLFLLGEETRAHAYLDGLEELLAAFPNLRRADIPGQQHIGHVLAAEQFASLVTDFVSATPS